VNGGDGLLAVTSDMSAASPFVQCQTAPASSHNSASINPAQLMASPAAMGTPSIAAAVEVSPQQSGADVAPQSTASNALHSNNHKSPADLRSSRAQSQVDGSRGRQTGSMISDGLPHARRRSGHLRTKSNSSMGSSRSIRGSVKDRDGHRSRMVRLPNSSFLDSISGCMFTTSQGNKPQSGTTPYPVPGFITDRLTCRTIDTERRPLADP
jgi:hypothetical protein